MGATISVIESALSIKNDDRPPSGSTTPPSNRPSLSPPLRCSTRGCAGDQETTAKYHHNTIPGDDSCSVDFTTRQMDEDDLAQEAASLLKVAAGVLHGMRAQDDMAAALQSVAGPAAGPPAARTGEFFYTFFMNISTSYPPFLTTTYAYFDFVPTQVAKVDAPRNRRRGEGRRSLASLVARRDARVL